MRVIQPGQPEPEWRLIIRCDNCKAELEIDASDLQILSHTAEQLGVVCPFDFCRGHLLVNWDQLPHRLLQQWQSKLTSEKALYERERLERERAKREEECRLARAHAEEEQHRARLRAVICDEVDWIAEFNRRRD